MLRFAALLSLVVSSMASCGGDSTRAVDDDSGGTTASGGSFATGGSATGGSSGAAGGSEDCLDGGFQGSLRCYSTCSSPPSSFGNAGECRDGSWQCPIGMVPLASCPAESCIHREEDVCCFHETGTRIHEPCDESGMRMECPAESDRIPSGSICLPDGVEATHCRDLEDLTCSNLELRCVEGSGCGTVQCACETDPDTGEASWRCIVLVC